MDFYNWTSVQSLVEVQRELDRTSVTRVIRVQYKYYKIGTDISSIEFKEMFPGVKTVPVVAVFGFNIGGYDALENYLEEVSGGYGD